MNAKVANVSLGVPGTSATLDNAIKSNPNTLYVVAAGNDGVNNDTSPHTPCNPATDPGRGEQDLRRGHGLQRRARRLLELRRRQRRPRGPGRQHPEHRPDEDRLQRRLRDGDRGPLDDQRRRADRDAALGAHHAVLDQPHPQPHRLAWRGNYVSQPGQLGAQHHRLQPHRGQQLQGHRPGEDRHRGQLRRLHHRGHPDPRGRRELADDVPLQRNRPGHGDRRPAGRLQRADRRLRPLPPGQRWLESRTTASTSTTSPSSASRAPSTRRRTSSSTAPRWRRRTSPARPRSCSPSSRRRPWPRSRTRSCAASTRRPSLTGKVATGGRLNLYKAAAESTAAVSGGVLHLHRRGGTEEQRHGHPLRRRRRRPSTGSPTPTRPAPRAQQSGSRINPGAGCTRVNDTTVKCPVAGITRIVLNGGDQDDTLNAGTIAIPVTLDGGAGLDALTGGTAGDSLIGGTGADGFTRGHRQRHHQRPQRGRRHELQLRRERRRQRHRERRPLPERPGHRQRRQLRGGQQAVGGEHGRRRAMRPDEEPTSSRGWVLAEAGWRGGLAA